MDIKLCTFNCKNFKANTLTVEKFVADNDICFFVEHWLVNKEAYLFNSICSEHSIIYKSDFDKHSFSTCGAKRRGRPFGGTCWVVKESLKIASHDQLSEYISKVSIECTGARKIHVYGVWFSFDDGSFEKYSLFLSGLSVLEAEIKSNSDDDIAIIGDFNADFHRGKRFDIALRKFVNDSGVQDLSSKFDLDH